MLQPLQLEEVKTRYAKEIAELQDFLEKAGCLPGAPESLHTMVKRLQRDRAFHRDLTSYIWVAIHSGNRNISYADLLGVLAVAAAGGRYAAEAEGDDAHALLRFVIEARESLDGTSREKNPPAPPVVPAQPIQTQTVPPQPAEPEPTTQHPVEPQPANVRLVQERSSQEHPVQEPRIQEQPSQSQSVEPPRRTPKSRSVTWGGEPRQEQSQPAGAQPVAAQQAAAQPTEAQPGEPPSVEPSPVEQRPVTRESYDDDGPLYPHARPFPEQFSALKDEEDESGSTRRRLIWLTVCFLAAALVARIAFHDFNLASRLKSLSETATPAAPPAVTAPAENPAPATNTPPAPHTEAAPEPAVVAPPPPAVTTERSTRTPHGMSRARGTHAAPIYSESPQPATVTAPAPATAPSGPAPKIPPAPAPHTPPPTAPPTSSAPRTASPSDPDLTNTDRGRAVPHLLRRTPEEQAELADASPPANMPAPANVPATAAASRPTPTAAPAIPHGSVRAISLGVNASNVLYSPTPVYPKAASDAHIQGDVKVETNVDRNGNVASVRVVSGPPLLRDAALDAAQRWRYRPHFIGGDQASMNAITVFEFQLP